MEIYFCEYDAIKTRLEFLENNSLTVEQVDAMSLGDNNSRIEYGLTDNADEGYIDINGILSNSGPSWLELLFGLPGTGYNDIIGAIDELVSVGIKKLVLNIESPGGQVGIVDKVWTHINSLDIETEARSNSLCASAAYYIASACDKITTTNPLSVWGSIGAVVTGIDQSAMLKKLGVKVVEVVSDNAPKKHLGLDTKEGIEEIRNMVNSAERQFIGRISSGRKISVEEIQQNFGRGGTMHAFDYDQNSADIVDAIRVNMVDYIVGPNGSAIKTNGDIRMDEEERNKIKAEATLAANISNVKNFLSISDYPRDVVAIGTNVITGEAKIEDFYAAVKAHDKKVLEKSVNESVVEEKLIPVQPREQNEKPSHLIHDQESMTANKNDFARR